MTKLTLTEKRDLLRHHIIFEMTRQGRSELEATIGAAALYFFDSRDIHNLFACLTSDMPNDVKNGIIAHDFNGLSGNDAHFIPKSRQFETTTR
jgi:hypothetical protein